MIQYTNWYMYLILKYCMNTFLNTGRLVKPSKLLSYVVLKFFCGSIPVAGIIFERNTVEILYFFFNM